MNDKLRNMRNATRPSNDQPPVPSPPDTHPRGSLQAVPSPAGSSRKEIVLTRSSHSHSRSSDPLGSSSHHSQSPRTMRIKRLSRRSEADSNRFASAMKDQHEGGMAPPRRWQSDSDSGEHMADANPQAAGDLLSKGDSARSIPIEELEADWSVDMTDITPGTRGAMSESSIPLKNLVKQMGVPRNKAFSIHKGRLIESLVWFSFHTPRSVLEDLIQHELAIWQQEMMREDREDLDGSSALLNESATLHFREDNFTLHFSEGEESDEEDAPQAKPHKNKGRKHHPTKKEDGDDDDDNSGSLSSLSYDGKDDISEAGTKHTTLTVSKYMVALPKSVERDSALMFVDISGFTKLSTILDVESLSKVINSYFDMIVSEVIEYGGDILKFAGDAFFAEWRAEKEEDFGDPKLPRNPLQSLNQSLSNFTGTDLSWFDQFDKENAKLAPCVLAAAKCGASIVKKFSDYHVTAAREMSISFGSDGSSGRNEAMLNVHCGIGCGHMVGLHVGDYKEGKDEDAVELRREYLFLGDPIEQVAVAADVATDGQVLASPEALRALADYCELSDEMAEATGPVCIASRNDMYLKFHHNASLGEMNSGAPMGRSDQLPAYDALRMHAGELNHAALARLHLQMALYVHPVVRGDELAKSSSAQGAFWDTQQADTPESRHLAEAELRSVYVMFIKAVMSPTITGRKDVDEELYKKLGNIMHVTSRELDRYSGHLRQFIVDDKGVVLIATFGLRGSTFPNMVANNALPATFSIHQALSSELKVENRIGATFGKVYCGVVGGLRRHEFAVMGAPVNLAARLMATPLNGGILVDEAVRAQADSRFAFRSLPPVNAKGYDKPVPILEPLHQVSTTKKKGPSVPFTGRREERRLIASIATEILENPTSSESSMVFLMGESGMGKSALSVAVMDEIRKKCARQKKKLVSVRSTSSETDQRIPLGSFRRVFLSAIRDLCLIEGSNESDDRVLSSAGPTAAVRPGLSRSSSRRGLFERPGLIRSSSKKGLFEDSIRGSFDLSAVPAPPPGQSIFPPPLSRTGSLGAGPLGAPALTRTSSLGTTQMGRMSGISRAPASRTAALMGVRSNQSRNSGFPNADFQFQRQSSMGNRTLLKSGRSLGSRGPGLGGDLKRQPSHPSVRSLQSRCSLNSAEANGPRPQLVRSEAGSKLQGLDNNLTRLNRARSLGGSQKMLAAAPTAHKGLASTRSLMSRNSSMASARGGLGVRPQPQNGMHNAPFRLGRNDSSNSLNSVKSSGNSGIPYFQKLCWACENLDYPYEYADIVGSQFLGLDKASPVTHVDGHVPTVEELADFMAQAYTRITSFADLVLIFMDDFQWVDSFTWKVIRAVCETGKKVLVICAMRSHDKQAVRRLQAAVNSRSESQAQMIEISLGPLDLLEIRALMVTVLKQAETAIDESLCTDIYQKTGGLPVYVVELLENIKRNKTLVPDANGKLRWTAEAEKEQKGSSAVVMVETFLSRFDALDPRVRKVLQTCAVLGLSFALSDLIRVHPELEEFEIENALDAAVEESVLIEQIDEEQDDAKSTNTGSSTSLGADSGMNGSSFDEFNCMDDRFFQFSHAMWRKNVLMTMLKGRKIELHRLVAEAMEKDQLLILERSDIARLLTLFDHWKQCGDFTKAAPLALAVGARLEEWELSAQSLELYQDALSMCFESLEGVEERDGDRDDDWRQVSAKPEILDLILRLHLQIGQCHELDGDLQKAATTLQDAYTILKTSRNAAPASKALMMPILSGLCTVRLLDEASDKTTQREQEMHLHNFVKEAQADGNPLHICRALSMEASFFAHLKHFDRALKDQEQLKTVYDQDEHSEGMIHFYGRDFAVECICNSVEWYYLVGNYAKALEQANFVIKKVVPRQDPGDVDNMMQLVLPILNVLKFMGKAQEADVILKKHVINPFHDHEDSSTFWVPLFNPMAYLLEVIKMEDIQEFDVQLLDEIEEWAIDENNSDLDPALELIGYTLLGELCWRLANLKPVSDSDRRPRLVERARELLTPVMACGDIDAFLGQTARALLQACDGMRIHRPLMR